MFALTMKNKNKTKLKKMRNKKQKQNVIARCIYVLDVNNVES